MRISILAYLWSAVPVLLGIGLLPSWILSLADHDGYAPIYGGLAGALVLLGGITRRLGRRPERLSPAEGRMVVLSAWLAAAVFGGLPYLLSQTAAGFTQASFESISGFTATGSTILADIEALPRSLLLWRSLTHWIGGLGIIAMVIAVAPSIIGRDVLFGAEAPLSLEEPILPRLGMVVRSYLSVYVALTLVEIVLLWLGPMDLFDSVCHAFAAIAGGGFSTRNLSIAAFDDLYTEIVLCVFMIAGAVSFFLHYRALFLRQPWVYLRNGELRVFLSIIAAATAICALVLVRRQELAVGPAIRESAFNVISIITTTGFASEDFEVWPSVAALVLVALMFVGGCSASTSGSIKCVRYQVAWKSILEQLRHMLHPHSVSQLRLGRRPLSERVVTGVLAYFVAYVVLALLATLALTLGGSDVLTSFTAVAATLGNVGPGLGEVGPFDNFAHLAAFQQWILMLCMLAGRLEIHTLAFFLLPEVWREERIRRRLA